MMKDVDEFKKKTGITDDRVDSIIKSVITPIAGPLSSGARTTTTAATQGEPEKVMNLNAMWRQLAGLRTKSRAEMNEILFGDGKERAKKDEEYFDAEWRPAPEALPEHEEGEDEEEKG